MSRMKCLWPLIVTLFILAACESKHTRVEEQDTYYKGTIHISCDETFKPVMDEQVSVYEADYPDAHIIVHYKPEAECLKDFLVDSIRMVIGTRGCSAAERQLMNDSLNVGPENLVIAHDLISVIVNPSGKDSFFTINEIKELLTGKSKKNLIPVFDGTAATSTVRFMLDSVLKGEKLGNTVVAAQSSIGVIDYVSKTTNAVGFVGFSWIGNQDDPIQASFRKKVKTAWIESTDSADSYIKPSQYFIYTKSYPLVRDLVYVLKEKHEGLAHGFAFFLQTMRGQLIFRRAYIMPVIYPNYLREAELKDSINK